MARYIPDIKTQRWVIIAPGRSGRSNKKADIPKKVHACVFCPGNEHMTPPEEYRIGGGEKDKAGWGIRVVPNKFPITEIHEVIIHSTDHEKDFEELPQAQVGQILMVYVKRYRKHEVDGKVFIFCNHGKRSGASLTHPHSQLVVVPKQISLDILSREPVENVVEENGHFISYCPEFSQWPYETWIVPKVEGKKFGDVDDTQVPDLAYVLQRALRRIVAVSQDKSDGFIKRDIEFAYNFYIYHGENWYLRIIPRFVYRAGFELGTGLNVNVVDPKAASQKLQTIEL